MTQDGIYIRSLIPADWEILRAMRIRALEMHLGYFFGDPVVAKGRSASFWQETLDGQNKQVFGLFDGDVLIGITAIFLEKEDPTGLTGVLAFNFIEPEYRGRGLADLFYKARIQWALENTNWTKIVTGHRAGNEASRKAILRNGFVLVDREKRVWPGDQEDCEYNYELDLRPLRTA